MALFIFICLLPKQMVQLQKSMIVGLLVGLEMMSREADVEDRACELFGSTTKCIQSQRNLLVSARLTCGWSLHQKSCS